MIHKISRRNAQLAIAASFFTDLAFVLPIWFLYSVDHLGLSPFLAVLLFTGVFFISGLFEIPTGAIADRVGRKKAFIIGKLLFLLFPLAYIFHFPLPLLLCSTVLAGIGNSLSSGALEPLVHAAYEADGASKREYNVFFSRSQAALFLARVVSGIGGALLYVVHPILPFVGWGLATICNIIIGLRISDAHTRDRAITYRAHISSALNQMWHSEIIISLVIMSILIGLVTEAIWTGYQAFYDQDGQNPLVIGSLFSIIALFGAITVLLVRRTYAYISPFWLQLIGSLLTLLTAFLIFQENNLLRLMAVLPMAVAAGYMHTTVLVTIQHIIPNKYQSTSLAVQNMVAYGVYFIGSVWIGWVIGTHGIDAARSAVFYSALASSAVIFTITLYHPKGRRFILEDKDSTIKQAG